MPGSLPSRTARVTAAEPKRSRTPSSAASSAPRPPSLERQRQLDGVVVVEVGDRDARPASARARDQRHARRASSSGPRRGSPASRAVASGSVCDRVARVKSSNRSRSVDRPADAVRLAHPPRDPVDQRRRAPRRARPPAMPRGASRARAARPIDRRRAAASTRRGSRLWASAWRWRPAARPSIATSAGLAERRRRRPTVRMPARAACAAVAGPTPHSRSTGQRVQERELAARRHDEQPVGLARPRSPPWPGTSCARPRP